MITPRATRLVRAADLRAFRRAVAGLATAGAPLDARDRLLVVPTHAAAAHLRRAIEDEILAAGGAVVLPDMVTPGEMVGRLAARLAPAGRRLTEEEREVILGVAARAAAASGAPPPFRLRPGLVAEMLRFYDTLRLNGQDVDAFERLALGALEPGAADHRGAERLVRQTRFLAAAFREFERRCAEAGEDDHRLRERLLTTTSSRPFRHVVVAVGDRAVDPFGLFPAHWDLLARAPGIERLDVVVTDAALAGPLHEGIHRQLPGIEEVRAGTGAEEAGPVLVVPPGGGPLHLARDREEEVAGFARRVKAAARTDAGPPLDRTALVVRQPLPYLYLAREVLRSAGIPCQMFDALPLAAEPYAAAVDLVLAFVAAGFARAPGIALLQSPHFRLGAAAEDVRALDRALEEAGFLGELQSLERILAGWRERAAGDRPAAAAVRAGERLEAAARALAPLREAAPPAAHLATLLAFLTGHDRSPHPGDPLAARHLRARAAVLGTIEALRRAYERFDQQPVAFDDLAASIRRCIEGRTFAPRTGDAGVHVVDADSARFGAFDVVQIAGVVDGEWPEPPRRNVFHSPSILRDLGWPPEAERADGARAAFIDLLRLPARRLVVSAFVLEADALVSVAPVASEIERAGPERVEEALPVTRIFEHEALGLEPVDAGPLSPPARQWLYQRLAHPATGPRHRGFIAPFEPPSFSLGAIERYQQCPFRFFAADVLRLDDAPDDGSVLSPRARGRLVHEVLHQFFLRWDRDSGGAPITADRIDAARRLFAEVAEPLLAGLPEADAALERARLFGSAVSLGVMDILLGIEASRPAPVEERWLEHRLEGAFTLGADASPVRLRGVADRIDLLPGGRLRVIDYKTGSAPDARRALQAPIYALCAQERLRARDGRTWIVEEAAYVAFGARRPLVPVVRPGHGITALADARTRLFAAIDGARRGEFPPRPDDPMTCRTCAYPTVCRKDYVDAG